MNLISYNLSSSLIILADLKIPKYKFINFNYEPFGVTYYLAVLYFLFLKLRLRLKASITYQL